MKTSSMIFLCLLVFVAGLVVGYHVGHRPSLRSKQGADLVRLPENSDAYYWYYRNVWLPNYLAEHHVQAGRPKPEQPTGVTGGSSAPRSTSQGPGGSAFGR